MSQLQPILNNLLLDLPPELLFDIAIQFLEPRDILQLSQVSRWLNAGLCRDDRLWKYYYQRDLSKIKLPPDGRYYYAYGQAYQQIQRHVKKEKLEPYFSNRTTPLMKSIKAGYEQLVVTMVGQDWILREFAIQIAAVYGHHYIIKRLLQRDALNRDSIMWNELDYDTAMGYAAKGGHQDIVEHMLELGATDYGETMMWAAEGGQRKIMERMIELGATHYNLSMICAARRGQQAIVEWLFELSTGPGARWTPTDPNYRMAIEQATENNHFEIVDLIRSRMAMP